MKVTNYNFPQGAYNFLLLWNGLDYGSIFLKKHLAKVSRKHRFWCQEAKGNDVFKAPITVPGTEKVLNEGGGNHGDRNGGIVTAITGQGKSYILWWLAHIWNTYTVFLKMEEEEKGTDFENHNILNIQTHYHGAIRTIWYGRFIISIL